MEVQKTHFGFSDEELKALPTVYRADLFFGENGRRFRRRKRFRQGDRLSSGATGRERRHMRAQRRKTCRDGSSSGKHRIGHEQNLEGTK